MKSKVATAAIRKVHLGFIIDPSRCLSVRLGKKEMQRCICVNPCGDRIHLTFESAGAVPFGVIDLRSRASLIRSEAFAPAC